MNQYQIQLLIDLEDKEEDLKEQRQITKNSLLDEDKLTRDIEELHTEFAKFISDEYKLIVCSCDDSSCDKRGEEGEVPLHITNCSCSDCHRALGKL